MQKIHPDSDVLRGFLLGTLGQEENQAIRDHLLAGCDVCESTLQSLSLTSDTEPRTPPQDLWGKALWGAEQRVLEEESEQLRAPALAEEFLGLGDAERQMHLQNGERFRSLSLVRYLREAAFDLRTSDVPGMVSRAEASVAIAQAIHGQSAASGLTSDEAAMSFAVLGNAYRIQGDYRAAGGSFEISRRFLSGGHGDALDEARVNHLEADLLIDQGNDEAGSALALRAAAMYESCGDSHLAAIAKLTHAKVLLQNDALDDAAALYESCLAKLDPTRDEKVIVHTRSNLAIVCHELGRYDDALSLIRESAAYYRRQGDHLFVLRTVWMEAKIARDMGHLALAEKAFLEARNGFVLAGVGIEAAEISLELALMYSEQSRSHEVLTIADNLVPIFQSQDLHQEAIAALIVFRNAAVENRATASLVSGILQFFEELRYDPSAKYAAARSGTD